MTSGAEVEARHEFRQANARIVLALSILGHRPWCPDCRSDADDTRMALLGATIDELREGIPE